MTKEDLFYALQREIFNFRNDTEEKWRELGIKSPKINEEATDDAGDVCLKAVELNVVQFDTETPATSSIQAEFPNHSREVYKQAVEVTSCNSITGKGKKYRFFSRIKREKKVSSPRYKHCKDKSMAKFNSSQSGFFGQKNITPNGKNFINGFSTMKYDVKNSRGIKFSKRDRMKGNNFGDGGTIRRKKMLNVNFWIPEKGIDRVLEGSRNSLVFNEDLGIPASSI